MERTLRGRRRKRPQRLRNKCFRCGRRRTRSEMRLETPANEEHHARYVCREHEHLSVPVGKGS